ncbi:carbohydrate kinase family protein [Herbiconiux sp. L3-i23]|uniref:carbohydrate kinase family protein n=1 Tax=Herbiconiux sp. L3-i23 TaxID=2905871 RepID=UPI002051888C|nr:carbohydrate kinase family protein [Herbiconiux sp. L3-i23]BDI23991.1 ribokinase [Herbiconiux sp. L3-i23]
MTLAVVGYASLDYSTSTADFRGVDATSILHRGIASVEPGVGGIAHIVRAATATGADTEAISWVGPDSLGSRWREGLIASGGGTAGVSVTGSRSPSATLIEIGTGGTICLFDPADCHPDSLTPGQLDALAASTCVILTVSPRRLTEQVLDAVPETATLIWAVKHDDDAYTAELIARLLDRADVISFSEGERSYVSQDGVAPERRATPGTLVVETRGSRGVAWAFASADGAVRAGSIPVEPVAADDTTGAGDTFIGTLAGLAAQSGPLVSQSDEDVAALITSSSRAAGDLLRSRSTSGPTVGAPLKETL